jgi:hypothetical protein
MRAELLASQGLRDRLAEAGIADGLMYKEARNRPNQAAARVPPRAALCTTYVLLGMPAGAGMHKLSY